MKKKISRPGRVSLGLIIIILILVLGTWFILRFVIGEPEDDWICVDGQWVKHGNPSAPMPTKECGKKEVNVPQKETPKIEIPETEPPEQILESPKTILLPVPFTSQAPFGNWSNPIFQNACEEASLLMAILWVRGVNLISKEEAVKEIQAFVDFEQKNYGNFYDHSAADTAHIMREYWGYNNVEVENNISVKDILVELEKGNLVIVPVNGRKLGNPFYTPPGPLEHMLVIRGYDWDTQEFITNDAGTRHGENYRYKEKILENALRDYSTGYKEPIPEINKTMIVIKPKEI